ncbi:antitoxin VapB [Hephaestia caeni]|uniref:Antitoxin VapB n=1 Tax=Hephaestia caeni TaxID=645617 RepID=A0A397PBD7_9SPHN|nr:AbrB/MazE/SpoVT family DNA-binding domain-containing protein [Hephaestia caeni]RIA46886.1 antitoxin VapB [Hephaestia caeni]
MTKEYRAKVFKSGNSVALRLPKALGLKAGEEMIVREEHGKFEFEPVEDEPRRIDLTGVYGSHPGLKPVERLPMEPRELDREGKLLRRG